MQKGQGINTLIKIENLNYIYQTGTPFETHVLKNINLEIKKGSFVALIGHTGSGKSTLIQHLNALLKPTSGKIIIDGQDITDPKTNLRLIRQKVGLVFQYPEHQLFDETVYKDIAFGPHNMALSPEEIKNRVYEAIELVGIKEDKLEISPFELSGGQKRRVAIAGVLAMKPQVLILDEPTAGLDPKARDSILNRIKFLHEKTGITVILVSHSMEDVARIAEQVIVMNDGEVEMSGTISDIFSHAKRLKEIGLNIPQVTQLAIKLAQNGVDIKDTNIYTVEQAVDFLKTILS